MTEERRPLHGRKDGSRTGYLEGGLQRNRNPDPCPEGGKGKGEGNGQGGGKKRR